VLAASRDQERYYYGDPAMTSGLAQADYYKSRARDAKGATSRKRGQHTIETALSIGGALLLVAAGLAGHQQNTSPHGGVPA
jgi:hypothetical protein